MLRVKLRIQVQVIQMKVFSTEIRHPDSRRDNIVSKNRHLDDACKVSAEVYAHCMI